MHIRDEQVADELLYELRNLNANRFYLLFSSDIFTRDIDEKKETIFDIIFLYKSLGKAYIQHGYYEKAMHLYGEALWLSRQTFGDKDRVSAPIYNKLGNFYDLRSDYDTSISCYENALNALQEDNRYNNEFRGRIYYNMAEGYRKTLSYKKAERLYRKSGKLFKQYYGAYDMKSLRSYYMRYIVMLGSSLTLTLTLSLLAYKLLPCTRHVLRSLYC